MNWIWQNYCTVFTLNLEPGDVRFCSEFCHLYSLWLWIGILHIFGFSLFICAMKFTQIIFKFLFGYKNFVSDLFTGEQQKKETFKLSVFIMASHRYHFGELLKKLIYYPVHIEAPKSLASHRKFLSGCLLITFSVYIRPPFIQRNLASFRHREPLKSSHFWCGRQPAGKSIPQGLGLWGFWQWSHPSKLDRGPLLSVLNGSRQKLPRNPCSSVNEAKGSRWPQWTWETRASRNWVFTKKLMLEVKPLNSDWFRHNRERHYFFRRDLAPVKSKEKNKFLRVSHRGDKLKRQILTSLLQAGSVERFFSFVMSHN